MKLLYITSFEKTSGLANRFQVLAMAREFTRQLGQDFFFGASDFVVSEGDLSVHNFGTAKSYRLAFRVLRFCRKNDIKNIFCREPKLMFFVIFWNRLFFRLPLKTIYEIHELVEGGFQKKFIEKFLAKRVSLNILLTKCMAVVYIKLYDVVAEKIIVAPDGVDIPTFDIPMTNDEARRKYNLPIDKKIIGYFGRFKTMDMDKGLNDILQSLKFLPDDIVCLAMGGKKRDRDFYSEQAKKFGVADKVIFVEQFSQEILAEYQKACDILLMPFPWTRHFACYMSPLKMFEYMASSRPIVATDLPSIREVLNEKNAILIKPDNPDALAVAIKKLIENQTLGELLAKQARKDVENYTWEKRIKKILGNLSAENKL